jgi:hypothetical protein
MRFEAEKNIFEQVVEEAWNNPAFKASLIENPVAAIKALTGQDIKLPAGIDRLVVKDQSNPETAYLNIPVQLNMEDAELTEQQLEVVAGGVVDGGIYDGGCCWPPFKFPPFDLPIIPIINF